MIEVRHVSLTLGEFSLNDLSLQVDRGEYMVVIGPTGAGKTVLLECIAGLLSPRAGQVWLDGNDVTRQPPELRRVAYLPQDYALFPHLSVRENLEFGLVVQGRAAEAPERIAVLAGMLGIEPLLARRPDTLSGGEKQRVALGRALAVEPRVMLLDEPLSALDVSTRQQIGLQIRQIHDRLGITTVHISHDFEEALRLADRVALVHQGRVLQAGTPQEVFRRPACLFAAEFVRGENIFDGTVQHADGRTRVCLGGLELACTTTLQGEVHVMVRPEDMALLPGTTDDDSVNLVQGRILRVEDRGAGYAVSVAAGLPLTAWIGRTEWHRANLAVGEAISLGIAADTVHVFSPTETPSARHA